MRYVVLLLAVSILGCGSGSPFNYKKVKGKISYEDGEPLPGGLELRFMALEAPQVENAHPRPAIANVNAQGEFECVTSYKYGDGLIAGKHKVAINMGTDAKPIVPKEYTSLATTPLIIDTADSPFDIKVPKPKGNR
jgi:hypothetical protein